METRQIFMRRTDKKGGVTITDHWCWDAQRFIDARMEEARKEGGKVELITQDQYRAAVWPQHRSV